MVVRSLLTMLGFDVDPKGVNKYNQAIKGILKTTVKLSAVASTGLTALGTAFLKGAGDIEQTEIAFETMLGSMEKAQELMEDITSFAAKTPFQLTGLIQSSKQLLAFGIEQEKIIDTMTNLGNIAAGVGRDKLPTLVRSFGKIRTKGKATMEELNMLLEAGVPILDKLSENLNVTSNELFKMITAGKVGFTDVEEALNSMATGSGQFANLMAKQSKSFLGIWSNILDVIVNVRNAIGKKLLPISKELAKDFLDWLDINKEIITQNIADVFVDIANGIKSVISFFNRFKIIGGIVDLFKFFVALLAVFGRVINKVFIKDGKGVIKFLADWVKQNRKLIANKVVRFVELLAKGFEILLRVLKVIGPELLVFVGILGLVQKAMAIGAAIKGITALMNPWVLAIAAVIAIIVLLVRNWDKVKSVLQKVVDAHIMAFNNIKNIISDVITTIKNFIAPIVHNIKTVFNELKNTASDVFTDISDFVKMLFSPINDLINKVKELAEEFDVVGKTKELLANVGTTIKTGVGGALEKVIDFSTNFGDYVGLDRGNNTGSSLVNNNGGTTTNNLNVNATIEVPSGTTPQQVAALQEAADQIFDNKLKDTWGSSVYGVPGLEAIK